MTDTEPTSAAKFALSGIAVVLLLNFIMRILLKLDGAYVILPIPIVAAAVVAWWFSKSTGRAPTKKEQSLILWIYGGALATLFVAIALIHNIKVAINLPTAFIYLLYFLPYPALLQFLLSEKQFSTYFLRRL